MSNSQFYSSHTGLKVNDGSISRGERVANRRIITTVLKQSLALDVIATCFTISYKMKILAVCSAQVIYIFDLDELNYKTRIGRDIGGRVKNPFTSIDLNGSATLAAVCSRLESKISIFNIKTAKAEKYLDKHVGGVHQVRFNPEGDRIISSGEDGKIIIWNWKTGEKLFDFMRHSNSVRCVDFNPSQPERLLAGRSDGVVTAWDINEAQIIDKIEPDPSWDVKRATFGAWRDTDKFHTGGILCLKRSGNGKLLATGSSDNTCKIWDTTSYIKSVEVIRFEDEAVREAEKDHLINVVDGGELDNYLSDNPAAVEVPIGEVPITPGFHSELLFTLRHDSHVLAVAFNQKSDIVATGSSDATIRLWSAKRGILLFQINTPSPVMGIQFDDLDQVICICENRVLVFGVNIHTEEKDIPRYWQTVPDFNVEQLLEDQSADGINVDGRQMEKSPPQVDSSDIATISMDQMKIMLAHGRLRPTYLTSVVNNLPDVDERQLETNMRSFDLNPLDVARIIVNTDFRAEDTLMALSSKDDTEILVELVTQGNDVSVGMKKRHYLPLDSYRQQEQSVKLTYRDIAPVRAEGLRGGNHNGGDEAATGAERQPRAKSAGFERDPNLYLGSGLDDLINRDIYRGRGRGGGLGRGIGKGRGGDINRGRRDIDRDINMEREVEKGRDRDGGKYEYSHEYERQTQHPYFTNTYESDYDYAPNDFFLFNEHIEARKPQRGRIFHFIPSSHIKIAKDIRRGHDVKAALLTSFVGRDVGNFPNFDMYTSLPDLAPKPVDATKRIRFNDYITLQKAVRQPLSSIMPPDSSYFSNSSFQSSYPSKSWTRLENNLNLIVPARDPRKHERNKGPRMLFQTRALNVSFSPMSFGHASKSKRGAPVQAKSFTGKRVMAGHIYAEPSVMIRRGFRDAQPTQLIVGNTSQIKEKNLQSLFHVLNI